MKSIVIGTAGHIDHGKTALVKALTGIDADRLLEEKRRGITIDLGFAHLDLPTADGEILRIGFVDVPGHERFIRNMLAGVGGIDLVLLVIAADEAIKPQTREHFDILQLLGVQRGIAVLTKSDAVDTDTLAVVRMEVQDFLRGTFLDDPKTDYTKTDNTKTNNPKTHNPESIIPVSSLTGVGLDELKQAIVRVANTLPAREPAAIARLPIDRVFTMQGFGTVVTGTLIAGTVHREDDLEVFPAEKRVRVRGIQVHGQASDETVAGQRTALNIAGASVEDLSRGMTLTPPNLFETTRRADVLLHLLPSAKPLKNRARVHFHSHTMETVVEVALLEVVLLETKGDKREALQVQPGQDAFARLKLPAPALLLPGDRFILRQFSPVVTIGGGSVLDAAPILRMPGLTDFLNTLTKENREAILLARIARRKQEGISVSHLIRETGWTKTAIEKILTQPLQRREIVGLGEIFIHSVALEALKARIVLTLSSFHQKNPLVEGMGREELRTQAQVSQQVFEPVAALLIREKKIEIAGDQLRDLVRLPGRGVAMKDDEAESKNKIEDAFNSAGLQVPALSDVLAGLKTDKTRAQKIVTLLLREKLLIKISDDLVFHRAALDGLRKKIAAYKTKSTSIDVSQFKDLTGVSRKYAIPLLEYLDRERVTKRVGNARTIL